MNAPGSRRPPGFFLFPETKFFPFCRALPFRTLPSPAKKYQFALRPGSPPASFALPFFLLHERDECGGQDRSADIETERWSRPCKSARLGPAKICSPPPAQKNKLKCAQCPPRACGGLGPELETQKEGPQPHCELEKKKKSRAPWKKTVFFFQRPPRRTAPARVGPPPSCRNSAIARLPEAVGPAAVKNGRNPHAGAVPPPEKKKTPPEKSLGRCVT